MVGFVSFVQSRQFGSFVPQDVGLARLFWHGMGVCAAGALHVPCRPGSASHESPVQQVTPPTSPPQVWPWAAHVCAGCCGWLGAAAAALMSKNVQLHGVCFSLKVKYLSGLNVASAEKQLIACLAWVAHKTVSSTPGWALSRVTAARVVMRMTPPNNSTYSKVPWPLLMFLYLVTGKAR